VGDPASGHWSWRDYDAELEPRFHRWRVSQRTRLGVRDVACVSRIDQAEDAIVEDLNR
jgi:hypothetical protein